MSEDDIKFVDVLQKGFLEKISGASEFSLFSKKTFELIIGLIIVILTSITLFYKYNKKIVITIFVLVILFVGLLVLS